MTALVSVATATGSLAVVAPNASAASVADSYITLNSYQSLPDSDLHNFLQAQQKNMHLRDASTNLLPTEYGPGWCIDWGLDNPWSNTSAGYEVRKLTGASGRYGTGKGIAEGVRYAAINVVSKLTEDWQAYNDGNSSKITDINKKNLVLRALLGNDLTALNTARGAIYYGTPEASDPGNLNPVSVSQIEFKALTGFTLEHVTIQKGSGSSNYALIPHEDVHKRFMAQYNNDEYVTIIVPKNYDYTMTRQRNVTFQRIVPIEQPGINPPKEPWDGETVTKTVWTTPPATKTTETVALPPRTVTKTVEQPPRDVVTTVNYPATTVTETSTLPEKSVTTVSTRPEATVTTTVTPDAVTKTETTTVNGTPETKTVTETPTPYTTVVKTPGQPTTLTSTVTAETKTVTKEPSSVVETVKETPVKTTVETLPATTVTETKTVTPAPVSVTETVIHNENYYREKLYERVKEVREYYHYAGFKEGEKSKEIEVPKGIGGSWTFEIIKGGDIVTVERTDEGKLKITPKPDFKGEGDVEILITDESGNQHIYRVKVSDQVSVETETKVKVNNFFYTIDPSGADRVRVIEKNKKETYDWILVDEDGNQITPKPGTIDVVDDEEGIKVEILDPTVRGDVIVRVTEESGDVRENIVTIENVTKEFEVTRQLLNTSTAVIERRGGDFEIVSGNKDLVTIEQSEDGNDWIVKPAEGATGTVEIVFTDDNGIEYKYTLEIVEDPNGGPTNRVDEINYEDTTYANFQDGWTYEVVDNTDSTDQNELAKITKDGNRVTVDPISENGGTVVLRIKDKDGGLVGTWTVKVNPARDWKGDLQNENRKGQVTDRHEVNIIRGFVENESAPGVPSNTLKLVEGEDLLADKSKTPADGDFELHFKPGAEGTVKVEEWQSVYVNDELTEKLVTTYIYEVKPAPVRELNYTISADNQLNLRGTDFKIVEGEDLFALGDGEELQKEGANKLSLDLRRDAQGTIVIENRTEDGHVFEKYTINVTPGRETDVKPIKRTMAWDATATVNFNEVKDYPDTVKWIEGKDLVDTTEENKTLKITGKEGQTGTVIFEVEDKRGIWARYELEITDPALKPKERIVSTSQVFYGKLDDTTKTFQLVEGSQYFEAPETEGDRWELKPKADAVGKFGIVEEYNADGKVINRYRIVIAQGPIPQVRDQRDYLIEGQSRTFPSLSALNTFKVVSGSQHVDTKTVDGAIEITAKPGTAGETVRVEEYNTNGDKVRNLLLGVVPEGVLTAEGYTIADNKNLPVVIDNGTVTGSIDIQFPEGATGINVLEGGDLVDVSQGKVKDADGNLVPGATITVKEGVDKGTVSYIFVDKDGNQAYQKEVLNITVRTNEQRVEQQGSSAELDGKCIAGIVGLTAPLLLAIPLGILSQVQIPGLEGVSAQINGAIQQANDQIQRGLGIYDEDRAQRAAGIQGAFSIENPQMLGMAAGALGAISLGLLAVDGVMRACGAEEYTSSYMIGKATDNETLMNGSSGKADKKDNNSADEDKGSSKAEDSANKEK